MILSHRLIYLKRMPKSLLGIRIIRLISLIFLFAPFFLPRPVLAGQFMDAMTSKDQNLQKFSLGEDLVNPQGAQGLMTITAYGLSTLMLGSYDAQGNKLVDGGVNTASTLANNLYNYQPASGVQYLAYMGKRLNLISPAYAATPGQDFLAPMLDIWILNRNIAYVLFVVIFVTVGFMIMFRTRLNPQTVINIQLALPKIVVSLILVTFSYAISGFIIDLIFFFNKFLYGIYASPLKAFSVDPTTGVSTPITPETLDWLGLITHGYGNWTSILDSLAKIFSPASLVQAIKGDISVLFDVIVAFTIFGTALKIFFALLSKYVTLLIQAIFSPFIFLAAALPSSQEGLGGFLKSMLSSALAFPGMFLVFILSNAVLNITIPFTSLPPLNNIGTLTLIGGIQPYIALGILMAAPSVPQLIDQALGSKTPGMDMSQIGGALRKLPIIGGLIS